MLHEIFGEKEDQQDLGKLHRLKAEPEDREPAGRALGIPSEGGQNDRQQEHDISRIDQPVKIEDPGKVDQRQDQHDRQSQDHASQLPQLQRGVRAADQEDADRGERAQPEHQSEIVVLEFVLFQHQSIRSLEIESVMATPVRIASTSIVWK